MLWPRRTVVAEAPGRRSGRYPGRRGRGAALLLSLPGLLFGLACRGIGTPAPVGSAAGPPLAAAEVGELARLPAAAVPSQRLYRVAYQGPEGEGSLKLTLWLAERERFVATAADRLGRPVWALNVSGEAALWVDQVEETVCRRPARLRLPGWGVGPVTLDAVPALLLGRLPQPLERVTGGEGQWEGWDATGRRWTVRTGSARPTGWTLWRDDEPAWWWQGSETAGVLSQRGTGRQIRWEELVAEGLAGPLPTVEVPDGYREECRDDLP